MYVRNYLIRILRLGPISGWKEQFRFIAHSGYNAIHFVPLQKRGGSNSPYSIFDQLALSDDLFDKPLSEDQKYDVLQKEIEWMNKDMGLLSITDIVWNHTAYNSEWLAEHPEAGYNLDNSPHLRPAFELDEAILQFSADLGKYGLSRDVKTPDDLDRIIRTFKSDVLPRLKLWEFYVIDVQKSVAQFRNALLDKKEFAPFIFSEDISTLDLASRAALLAKYGLVSMAGCRFGTQVRMEVGFAMMVRQFHIRGSESLTQDKVDAIVHEYGRILDELNVVYYKEYDNDVATMIGNIKSRVDYERLAGHGPKMGPINSHNPLVSTYFTRIPRSEKNKNFDQGALAVANNGWIWNADPLVDFAGPSSKSYLIREVIPWGDCVKLRYGKGPEDNPWLWEHIGKYTRLMAKYFHGFRIDNCHSTPLHVAQYFLDLARQVRTDLYVIAELFTGSEERDITFVSKLGINSLIREAMNAWDAGEMSRLIHRHGGQPVGSMALRADYLPLELVGHSPADITSPILEKFHQQESGWFDRDEESPKVHASAEKLDHYVTYVEDPDESGRRTPLMERKERSRSRSRSKIRDVSTPRGSPYLPARSEIPTGVKVQRHVPHPSQHQPAPGTYASQHEVVFKLEGSIPHALFMDCTHDNETPYQRRTADDSLANAALVAMADCAIGSVRGYDELVPYHLNVVTESRKYAKPMNKVGIVPAKRLMMQLHYLMGQKGYTEIHVHQESEFVHVYRQNPLTHHGYLLIARCAFKGSDGPLKVSPVVLRNTSFKTLLSARVKVQTEGWSADPREINGFGCTLEMSYDKPLPKMITVKSGQDELGFFMRVEPIEFPPGSILLLETDMYAETSSKLEMFKSSMNLTVHGAWYLDGIVRSDGPGLQEALSDLSPVELNIILYRSDPEERDSTGGHGVYDIPNYGQLPYAGLQGFYSALRGIARRNDLGHPLCDHLRSGLWMLGYIVDRLARYEHKYPKLRKFREWLSRRFDLIKKLPNFLVPKYFNIVVSTACYEARNYCFTLMSDFVIDGSRFVRSLALGAVQMYGDVPSTGLSPLKPVTSLAAGLPHFSTRHMRCWGRDVFIALRGLFLTTGMFEAAKDHILYFASTVRHGLIPNLLDSGRRPRFNARDAVWFFMQSIQEYAAFVPGGISILDEDIPRRFTSDDFVEPNDPRAYSKSSTLREIMHEIMERHAQGIHFVEWNAGPSLDHAMRDEGFKVDINFDTETGLIFGGNRFNCGTWMDKMGDSEKAGIKGLPATPRDGAAIEIIALLKSSLRWIVQLGEEELFPKSVELKDGTVLSYQQWNERLQKSFEKCFYVPRRPEEDSKYHVDAKLVNRRGIYKDTYKSSMGYTDYQLRPNFGIAMAVAPELFTPENALDALKVGLALLGPLGMKTLDPTDWAYRPFYDNANDSTDPTVAHGVNYHQGPEWLWVLGYYLRALYNFSRKPTSADCGLIHDIQRILQPHRTVLDTSPFAGLPELTNKDGTVCHHSCPTQAWSMATLLDLIYELNDDIMACALQESTNLLSDIKTAKLQ